MIFLTETHTKNMEARLNPSLPPHFWESDSASKFSYQRAYGFYGNAFTLYSNS